MRAFAELLLTQCKMGVVIYGVFLDKNGKTKGATYVISHERCSWAEVASAPRKHSGPSCCSAHEQLTVTAITQKPSRYDTSQYLHESNSKVPLFRSIPNWDKDVREHAWQFFPAVLHPERATQEAVELVQGLQKDAREPTVFQTYEDGTPILFNKDPNGNALCRKDLVAMVRDFMKRHWGKSAPRFRRMTFC